MYVFVCVCACVYVCMSLFPCALNGDYFLLTRTPTNWHCTVIQWPLPCFIKLVKGIKSYVRYTKQTPKELTPKGIIHITCAGARVCRASFSIVRHRRTIACLCHTLTASEDVSQIAGWHEYKRQTSVAYGLTNLTEFALRACWKIWHWFGKALFSPPHICGGRCAVWQGCVME